MSANINMIDPENRKKILIIAANPAFSKITG